MPTNVNELNYASRFIFSQLTGHAPLMALVSGVFESEAPQQQGFPYVIFEYQSSEDLNAIPPDIRIFTRPIYLIKVVTRSDSYQSGAAIADQIEAAILKKSGVVDGIIQVMGEFRISPVRYSEDFQGIRYNHIGGLYKFFVHNL